jgi:two-component system response regulator NreC
MHREKKQKTDELIHVLIADDHGVLRAGLRALLETEPDIQVLGEADEGRETVRLTKELEPDIVLLDISMPGMDGVEVTRRLDDLSSDIRVLILTVHEDESLLQEAIDAGAWGYVTKRAIKSELISAIHAVSRGDMYVHPAMTRALLKEQSPAPEEDDELVEPLTPREVEVLRLIALGHTNRQASEILCISVRTVETHRANILSKLNASGRVELVRYAMDHDLLEDY